MSDRIRPVGRGIVVVAGGLLLASSVCAQERLTPPGLEFPYLVEPACPGEGCAYGAWLSCDSVPLYGGPDASTRLGTHLAPLETFDVESGAVVVHIPEVVVVTRPTRRIAYLDTSEMFEPEDTLYVLDYLGEGFFNIWFEGSIVEVEVFWPWEPFHPASGYEYGGRVIQDGESSFWARGHGQRGSKGWVWVDRAHMAVANEFDTAPLECGPAREGFRAWVGLYDHGQLGWLENENRLDELCADAPRPSECLMEKLSPMVSVYSLYSDPDRASYHVGDLIVVGVPGRPLSALFRAAGSERTVRFEPDLFLPDWGYGPYFHHTFSAAEGDWFLLPPGPWEENVWIHRGHGDEHPDVITLHGGDVIEMDGSSWTVVSTEPDALLLRSEQPADMWCEPGDPPVLAAVEPTRFSRTELSDSLGHLKFRLKYMKGC